MTKALRKIALHTACMLAGAAASLAAAVPVKQAGGEFLKERSEAPTAQNDTKRQFDLAEKYYFGRDVPQDNAKAALLYRKAAEQGDSRAQFRLCSMFHDGKGVPQDYAEAISWCRKAADQHDRRAEAALGYAYFNGEGVTKDYFTAMRWYREGADQGYALAQQGLGYGYANGTGVTLDYTQAVVWYRKAAEQGDPVAQQSLGSLYESGRGVPRDQTQALAWYAKAAAQGDANAKLALARSENRSRPLTNRRYLDLGTALLALAIGMWLSLDLAALWRKPRDRRQTLFVLMGFDFLLYGGLRLYGSTHNLRYPLYCVVFGARIFLVSIATVMMAAVVLLAWKRANPGRNT